MTADDRLEYLFKLRSEMEEVGYIDYELDMAITEETKP